MILFFLFCFSLGCHYFDHIDINLLYTTLSLSYAHCYSLMHIGIIHLCGLSFPCPHCYHSFVHIGIIPLFMLSFSCSHYYHSFFHIVIILLYILLSFSFSQCKSTTLCIIPSLKSFSAFTFSIFP